MQKVRQNDLNFSENPFFFCFWSVDKLLCKRFEQFCNSRKSGPVIQKAFLKRHLQFFYKSFPNDRKVVEKQKSTIFDNFGNFTQV